MHELEEINATDAEGLIKGNACLGGDSCCVNGNCGVGEGDCDSDSDCKPGIKFYQLYCNYFFHFLIKSLLTLAFYDHNITHFPIGLIVTDLRK